MTTYILHGGYDKYENSENDRYWRLFTQLPHKKHVRILGIYWAREPKDWAERVAQATKRIKREASSKTFEFIVAKHSQDFEKSVATSDVIYFAGGEYPRLKAEVDRVGDIQKQFDNKVIVGTSAGAILLTSSAVDPEDDQLYIGLGSIPVNFVCHWNVVKDREEKLRRLRAAAPGLPILTLNESQWVVFYQ